MRFFLVATLISSPLFAESDYLTQNLEQISKEILQHGDAYTNLSELTQLGPRLCGSEGAAKAIEWAQKKLESYKVDRVWLQPVSVPHWVPGNSAKAQIVLSQDPNFQPVNLAIAPLGNSPGAMGVEAEVIEVKSVQEVANLGEQARGKIIFLNSPMPILPNPFEAYSKTVGARTHGPNAAAKNGAVAALVRSVSTLIDDNPHAGVTIFDQKLKPIPAAALSTQAANQLSAILAQHQYKDKKVRIKLMFNSQKLPDVTSYNVIAELKGRELPNEVVVVGGHMDSWYLAAGAHDDGAAVVESIEVLRALAQLPVRPKRTVRVVLFMAEEFGGMGSDAYAKFAKKNGEIPVAGIEADQGCFTPQGFTIAQEAKAAKVRQWAKYLKPLNADQVWVGYSAADVAPLEALGAAGIGYVSDPTHYFDYHHSAIDKFEAIKRSDLEGGVMAMVTLTYLISELGI